MRAESEDERRRQQESGESLESSTLLLPGTWHAGGDILHNQAQKSTHLPKALLPTSSSCSEQSSEVRKTSDWKVGSIFEKRSVKIPLPHITFYRFSEVSATLITFTPIGRISNDSGGTYDAEMLFLMVA